MAGQRGLPGLAAWTPVQGAGPGQQAVEKASPNALAITKETLAPLDTGERETLRMLPSRLG
jgi:hypothetical protein